VTELIFCAVELSDVLSEDMPKIDWVRLNLRNMGLAIGEYIETAVRDLLIAGAGLTQTCASDLTYTDIVNAIAKQENVNWIAETRFLIVCPDSKAKLLLDTQFIATERYTTVELANLVNGEIGKFASCRVLVSPLLDGMPYALMFVGDEKFGTVATIVYKRQLTTKSERDEKKETTFMVSSVRVGLGVVQSKGILRFDITNTP